MEALAAGDALLLLHHTDSNGDGEITWAELIRHPAALEAYMLAQHRFVPPPTSVLRHDMAWREHDLKQQKKPLPKAPREPTAGSKQGAHEINGKLEQVQRQGSSQNQDQDRNADENEELREGNHKGTVMQPRALAPCSGCTDGTAGSCFVRDGASKLCFDVEADGKCSPGTHMCISQN